MNNYENVFNSETDNNFKKFQLANGYIFTTEVLFEKEEVIVEIEAKGHIQFYNDSKKPLMSVDVPAQTGGKEVYDEVLCAVENGVILLRFPIVEWIDNYPNCDGEYDRWDTAIIGHHIVKFDKNKREIDVL